MKFIALSCTVIAISDGSDNIEEELSCVLTCPTDDDFAGILDGRSVFSGLKTNTEGFNVLHFYKKSVSNKQAEPHTAINWSIGRSHMSAILITSKTMHEVSIPDVRKAKRAQWYLRYLNEHLEP